MMTLVMLDDLNLHDLVCGLALRITSNYIRILIPSVKAAQYNHTRHSFI